MKKGISPEILVTTGIFGVTICAGVMLAGSYVNADDVVDDVSIEVPTSCSMSGSGTASHTAEIANGTYQANIGTTTINVLCNDNAGFSIYAAGYTGQTIGQTNSNKLVGTEASSNATIDTGTATTAGNPDVSNWAMKLATDSEASYPLTILSDSSEQSFASYHAVPNEYTKVATRLTGTDVGTGATGSTLTTTYAAYISKTQPADTYSGKVKYTLVHPNNDAAPPHPQPSLPGNNVFHGNANDVIGSMGSQSTDDSGNSLVDGATVTLYASNFSRNNYGFAGWSDRYDYATNPNAKFYGPNETITAPDGTTTKGLSLYAVWIHSAGSLQTDATRVCNSLTQAPTDGTADLSSVSALTDQRDGQTYAIAKLADGNCWMIENLRLEAANTRSARDIALAQGYDGVFAGLADPETFFDSRGSSNSLYSTDGSTAYTIEGYMAETRLPRYDNRNIRFRQSSSSYSTGGYTYSMGNYYTWSAAIADTSYYDYSNGDPDTSICPLSWRLPTGNSGSSDAATLVNMVSAGYDNSSLALRSYPNNFVYAGSVRGYGEFDRGSAGGYWTFTSDRAHLAVTFSFDTSTASYYGVPNKTNGFPVRCMIKLQNS